MRADTARRCLLGVALALRARALLSPRTPGVIARLTYAAAATRWGRSHRRQIRPITVDLATPLRRGNRATIARGVAIRFEGLERPFHVAPKSRELDVDGAIACSAPRACSTNICCTSRFASFT